jgi:plastocyanin
MKKTIGVTLILLCAGLAAAVSVARPASTAGTLDAKVGPGFTISLTQNGARVTHLDPGTYTIDVDDQAAEHNFHLSGPGVDQATTVEDTGTTTWTVTFQDGTYSYQCDAHASTMHGSFTVGDVAATTPATPKPAPLTAHATAKAVGRLVSLRVSASRTATFTISLVRGTTTVAHRTAKGTAATFKLKAPKAGRYVAKVVATAGGATARATASVTVK